MASPEWTVERHELSPLAPAPLRCAFRARGAATRRQSRHAQQGQRGFAGARPKGDELLGYFDVGYRVDDPRITSVAPYQKDLFVHHFRIDAVDVDVERWIRDAYEQVGCGNR